MTGLLALLQEFHRDKLAVLLRHEAAACAVTQYDVNNAYQHIINRDEEQLSWLSRAITELDGSVDAPAVAPGRDGSRAPIARAGPSDDAREAQAFVDRWQPRVDAMTNARHRRMLSVILGETLEQKRTFEQAAAGRTDLLGPREREVGPLVGEVLPTRWIE